MKAGKYVDTYRKEGDQSYTYSWAEKCYFKTYTPSNQYLFEKGQDAINTGKHDFSHFGLIGHDYDCFWGLYGVFWIKPLPVWQEVKALESAHGTPLKGTYDYPPVHMA